jgi:hypothetical protein
LQYRLPFAITLAAALGLSLLLTPIGFETRALSSVTSVGFFGLGVYSIGFVLSLVSLVLLLAKRRGRVAGFLGTVGQALFLPIILSDLSGHFSSLPAPSAIPPTEVITMLLALVNIFFGVSVMAKGRRENKVISTAPKIPVQH